MQVEALKTFSGRLGLIRTGSVITVPERYGKELVSKGLAKPYVPRVLEPDSNTALGGPENTKDGEDDLGNGDGGSGSDEDDNSPPDDEVTSKQSQDSGSTASSTAGPRAGGRGRPLSSQQVGRRSRKKT